MISILAMRTVKHREGKSHSQEVLESRHGNPGILTPTWFERSHTSLTHIPIQVKEAGGRQSPFVPKASVFLSLCLLLSPVSKERRVQALLPASGHCRREVGGKASRSLSVSLTITLYSFTRAAITNTTAGWLKQQKFTL